MVADRLNTYFQGRVGCELLKTMVKEAQVSPEVKDKVLEKIATVLSAEKIASAKPVGPIRAHIGRNAGKYLAGGLTVGGTTVLGVPYLMNKADKAHARLQQPYPAQQDDFRPKMANDNLAQMLGSAGSGFGKELVTQISRGVTQSPMTALSGKISKKLFSLPTRVQADEEYGRALYKNLGQDTSALLAAQVERKLKEQQSLHIDKNVYSPMRKQIFNTLVEGPQADPHIKAALDEGRIDNKKLWDLYKTMVRFSPRLSTDLYAVKSFFREVLHFGDGDTVNHVTIKQLADAEAAINKALEGYSA